MVDAAGAWAPTLAATVGLSIPVEPWRHHTAYFGLPAGRSADFPIILDNANKVYFRPEGHDLMLVGLETGKVVQVPLHIGVGDKLKIDTRTGDYISRA